jgi:hypothetical protein
MRLFFSVEHNHNDSTRGQRSGDSVIVQIWPSIVHGWLARQRVAPTLHQLIAMMHVRFYTGAQVRDTVTTVTWLPHYVGLTVSVDIREGASSSRMEASSVKCVPAPERTLHSHIFRPLRSALSPSPQH